EPCLTPVLMFRMEAGRRFATWLKGRDTGIMREPRLAVYVRDWHRPGPYLEEAPGHWRYEDGWPIARVRERVLHPRADRSLGDAPGAAAVDRLRYLAT